MLKHLLLGSAAILLVAGGAEARPLRGAAAAAPTVPEVIPGSATPNTTFNSIPTTYQGNSSDNGYNLRGFVRFDQPPLPEITTSRRIGVFAAHPPTDVEKAAGLESNICSVDMRANHGAWFTINSPTNNPDAGNVLSWNANFTAANFNTDGIQQVDVRAHPCTGPSITAEGPLADQYGNGYTSSVLMASYISNGGLTTAGNILTVAADNNGEYVHAIHGGLVGPAVISIGQSVEMAGVAPNTFIDGDSTHNQTSCVAQTGSNCTGAGQGGTYHVTQSQLTAAAIGVGSISGTTLTITAKSSRFFHFGQLLIGPGIAAGTTITGDAGSGSANCTPACTGTGGPGTYAVSASQTVGSVNLIATNLAAVGVERSFYFITNKNGTISRPVTYVSTSGSDSNNCTTSSTACATVGAAITVIRNTGTSTGNYGGTVCFMGGGSYVYGTGQIPGLSNGQLGPFVYQGADHSPCNAPGDPGGATLTNDGNSWQFFARNTAWKYLNFIGAPDPQTGSSPQVLWADHVTMVHDKLNNGSLLARGEACVDSKVFFGSNGICAGAVLIRGSTGKYAVNADGMHDTPVAVDNVIDGAGTTMEWMTARYDGTNVLKDVTILPAELSGYTLSQILNTGTCDGHPCYYTVQQKNIAPGQGGWNCLSDSYAITAIDDTNHTVTLDPAATGSGSCATNTVGYLYFDGTHADAYQLGGNVYQSDVFVRGNSFNDAYQSYDQGFFLEPFGLSGVYIADNIMHTDPHGVESMYAVDGSDDIWMSARNFLNGIGTYTFDYITPSTNVTMVKDQCAVGTLAPFTSGQINYRTLQAPSGACYSTSTP